MWYTVTYEIRKYKTMVVEADSFDDAYEKAEEMVETNWMQIENGSGETHEYYT